MTPASARCVILACGNTLRGDDGVGPWLAAWAEKRFQAEPRVRVIWRQQWTPELAEDIAGAEGVLFIDCSVNSAAGSVDMAPVEPIPQTGALATHHLGPAELLALAHSLYNSLPQMSMLLTIGAGSIELREDLSSAVRDALPLACTRMEETVVSFLAVDGLPK